MYCLHENQVNVGYDVIKCNDCGALKTDSSWGIASNMWFASRDYALFYKNNGRLPVNKSSNIIKAGKIKYTGVKEDGEFDTMSEEGVTDYFKQIKADEDGIVEFDVYVEIIKGKR